MLIRYLAKSLCDFFAAKSIGKKPRLLGKKKFAPLLINVLVDIISPL